MTTESTLTTTNLFNSDLKIVKELVYDNCGFDCTFPIMEAESTNYSACEFEINGMAIKYRVAKITPTKTGQFVTLWKRNKNAIIEPFNISDNIDLFVISTRHENSFGQFVFPKSVLHNKGIISDNNKEGKRAIRVYPPWDNATNRQARNTQQWQLEYFLEISNDSKTDLSRAKVLFRNL